MKLIELKQTAYYHGTARDDVTFLGLGKHWRGGIYFAPTRHEAEIHARGDAEIDGGAPKIISAYLKFSHPKHMSGIDSHEFTHAEIRAMMKEGYDAIINGGETAVFDSDQIEVINVEVLSS